MSLDNRDDRDEITDAVLKMMRKHFPTFEWDLKRRFHYTLLTISNLPPNPDFGKIVVKLWAKAPLGLLNKRRHEIRLHKGDKKVWVSRMGYAKEAVLQGNMGYCKDLMGVIVEIRRLLEALGDDIELTGDCLVWKHSESENADWAEESDEPDDIL